MNDRPISNYRFDDSSSAAVAAEYAHSFTPEHQKSRITQS